METEALSSATHPGVRVMADTQPIGLVAPIASIVSMTLGYKKNHLVSHGAS